MRPFHKHSWSEWVAIEWTTVNISLIDTYPVQHVGVKRVCPGCGKEQTREGAIYQELLKRGEL